MDDSNPRTCNSIYNKIERRRCSQCLGSSLKKGGYYDENVSLL